MQTDKFKYTYMHLDCMATKTITITVEAYDRLSSLKGEKDSFSEVIKRITKKSSLLELAGILSEKEAKEMRKNIKKMRKEWKDETEERYKRWFK